MIRIAFVGLVLWSIIGEAAFPQDKATARKTTITIVGDAFHINGKPTYAGRTWNGKKIEGLLLNSRMVQGIFDDLNEETRGKWAYPDTGKWDPERHTREFVAAMPEWRRHGLLSFTISLQGGSPQGYSQAQPWHNSAITADGELRGEYMARLEKILDRADELGMAPIVTVFYFGQDQRLKDEAAVKRAVERTIDWLHDHGYTNVLLEINNECNVRYDHDILTPDRVHELIAYAQDYSARRVKADADNGATPLNSIQRLYVSTSYGGGTVPRENVVRTADFLLMHGNGVSQPARIGNMVRQVGR